MQLTTEKIIQILPLTASEKQTLLAGWETMDKDLKFNLEQALWDTYDALFTLRLQENMQLGIFKAKENKEELDKGFYLRMEELTNKQMTELSEENVTSAELDLVRQRLQHLLQK